VIRKCANRPGIALVVVNGARTLITGVHWSARRTTVDYTSWSCVGTLILDTRSSWVGESPLSLLGVRTVTVARRGDARRVAARALTAPTAGGFKGAVARVERLTTEGMHRETRGGVT
jgi:hypothetical protein